MIDDKIFNFKKKEKYICINGKNMKFVVIIFSKKRLL